MGLIISYGKRILENIPFARHSRSGQKQQQRQIVCITGCDSGFGLALAFECLQNGFDVIAACFSESGAERLDLLSSNSTTDPSQVRGGSITTIVGDLSQDEDRKKLVEKVIEICGETKKGLYALVNNAGMEIPGCIAWTKPEVYKTTMQLNFHTPVYLIYELLPQLKKAKGRIINISSVAGLVPLPTTVAYSASKCALEGFSDCLRIEMRPFGVQVIIMEPSAMRTPMAQKHVSRYWELFENAQGHEYTDGYGPRSKEDMELEIQKQRNSLETKFEDPDIVVRDLMYALTTPKAPARILSGNMAKRFFNILYWLPCKWRDSILFRVSLQKHFR